MRNLIYIILIVLIGLSSCKKDKLNNKDLERIQSCHNENNLDSLALVQSLVGSKWEWKYTGAFEYGDNQEYENLRIRFTNSNIIVNNEGQETQYQWNLELTPIPNFDYYNLKTTPSFSIITGIILICDNNLIFHDSYKDSLDNYYKRVE